MGKKQICAVIASLCAAAPALGQYDDWRVEGSATIGPIWSSTSDTKDASKFEEYRDLGNGVLSNIWARGRSGRAWFEGYGENFGRDDQYLMLRGGLYDLFKYKIYSDSLQHNFLFNGRTPFAGAGTDHLVATFPQPDPATWNPVDLGYKRTDNGGYFEWQGLAPWYFRADFNQLKFDGTKVGSSSNGSSPGNGFTDLIFPVQYNTRNATFEAGYNTGKMNFSLSYLYSKFENDIKSFTWNNPFYANGVDTTYLAPDNRYQRIGANATFRGLPLRSTLAARYTWSENKSDAPLPTLALFATGSNPYGATNPNTEDFNGKIKNQTFTVTLASNPAKAVDTRVYYNYYKRDNESTQVVYDAVSGLNCGGPCVNDLFNYRKNNFGFDAYWRFLPGNRVGGGYDYLDVKQNRVDYDDIRWNRFFVEWKNTSLANLSARIKYTYLQRRSDYLLGNEGESASDPAFLARFTSAFDSSDLNRNEIKITADWTPLPLLAFSLEAIWKDNEYKNIVLGRTNDKREEIYLSGSYGDPAKVRATAFFDYERIRYDSNHRQAGGSCDTNSGPNCFDPGVPPTSSFFNWSARNKDRNWVAGLGVDWPVTPQLAVNASAIYYETNGSADIASQNNFGNPLPIHAYDDTKRTSLNLKAIYAYDRNWTFTVGYAYERWRYNDAGYDGYQYTIPFPGVTTNTSQSYLNGYLAFTNYTANIVYLLASYRFETPIR
jgi:MtrB/PioB family decaheme-associated outer membrane protein